MVTAQDTCERICSEVLKTTTDDVISDQCATDTCPLPLSVRRAGRKTTETIRVPYFVNLGDNSRNFTSATDYFNLNCLSTTYVPPGAAATSASAVDVSTSRRVHKKKVAPKAWPTRIEASLSNLPPHLDPDVVKGMRRGRRMKRLGSPTDFIKVSQTIRASYSNLVLDSRG